jgi:DNA repair protein RadC
MSKFYSMADLPPEERPRERLANLGAGILSLQELLALVLGRGIKDGPVLMMAQALLSRFGSVQAIAEASIDDLQSTPGVGFAKATQLLACFELGRRLEQDRAVNVLSETRNLSPFELSLLARRKLSSYAKEHLLVMSMDTRHKVLGIDTVSVGTLDANLVHPRETFLVAIRRHAAAVVIVHNHPSGDLEPSQNDLEVTKRLATAGKILGIDLIDHLIISAQSYLSFREQNLLHG